MSEKAPEVMGFERMETQLVREAIRNAGELYIEEIARNAIKHYDSDKAKRDDYITSAWTVATTFDLFHLLNSTNLEALWAKIRSSTPLSSALLNTAVKLRGMYNEMDWSALETQLAAGLDMLRPTQYAVMDSTATAAMSDNFKSTDRLRANLWVVPLVLLSYAPLVSMPGPLAAMIKAAEPAKPNRGPVT